MSEVITSEDARRAWGKLPEERRKRVLEHLDGEVEMHERAARTYRERASNAAIESARTAEERAADYALARRALS